GLRPRVLGVEHLHSVHAGILVANHASYIDAIVLMAALPANFHFVAKRTLAGYPLIGTVIRKAQHITIEKAALSDRLAGADEVARRVRCGELLMIFSEGTVGCGPGLPPFPFGWFSCVADSGQPVIPLGIVGTLHL